MPTIQHTTVTITAFSTINQDQQTAALVTWDQKNGNVIERKSAEFKFASNNNSVNTNSIRGYLIVYLDKETNATVQNQSNGSVPTISKNVGDYDSQQTNLSQHPNQLFIVASAGAMSSLHISNVKTSLSHVGGIPQAKIDALNEHTAFIFVLDTKSNKWFYDAAPQKCEMIIDINSVSESELRVGKSDFERMGTLIQQLQSKLTLVEQTVNSIQNKVDTLQTTANTINSNILLISQRLNSAGTEKLWLVEKPTFQDERRYILKLQVSQTEIKGCGSWMMLTDNTLRVRGYGTFEVLAGNISNNTIQFVFKLSGMSLPFVFTGTLQNENLMQGTMDKRGQWSNEDTSPTPYRIVALTPHQISQITW